MLVGWKACPPKLRETRDANACASASSWTASPGEVHLQAGLEGGDVNDVGCYAIDIMNMVMGRAPVAGAVNAGLRLANCAFLDATVAAAKAAAVTWGDISLARV